jgi:CRP-like cAMP-binding protein
MPDAPVDFRHLAGAGAPARDLKAGDGAPARDLKAGEVIFREGDPAHELFIIQSGEIEIRLGRVLETLPQYGIFGEMALIDSSPPQRNDRRRHRYEARFREREAQFLFLVSSRRIPRSTLRIMARRLRAANGLSSRSSPRFPLTDTTRERKRIARCPSL